MIFDSVEGAIRWFAYTNPLISNSAHGFNSVLNWIGITTSSEKQTIMKMERHNIFQIFGKSIYFYKIAGLLGASAVILGAYGAHVVARKSNPEEIKNFETANRYHFYHTFALFGVPFCRFPIITGALFISGTLIFCGPCYYNGLTGDKTFNKYTPTGGMILIAAWLSMIL